METDAETQGAQRGAGASGIGLFKRVGSGLGSGLNEMAAKAGVVEADANMFAKIGTEAKHPSQTAVGFVVEGAAGIAILGDEEEVVADAQFSKRLEVGHEFVAILETQHNRKVKILGSSGVLVQRIGMAVVGFADGGTRVVPEETDFGKRLEFADTYVEPESEAGSGTEATGSTLTDLAAVKNMERSFVEWH